LNNVCFKKICCKKYLITDVCIVTMSLVNCNYNKVDLFVPVGHFPTNLKIWPTKIHFGWRILLYIFNGMAINNLQNVLSLKKWPTNFWSFISASETIYVSGLYTTQHEWNFFHDWLIIYYKTTLPFNDKRCISFASKTNHLVSPFWPSQN